MNLSWSLNRDGPLRVRRNITEEQQLNEWARVRRAEERARVENETISAGQCPRGCGAFSPVDYTATLCGDPVERVRALCEECGWRLIRWEEARE